MRVRNGHAIPFRKLRGGKVSHRCGRNQKFIGQPLEKKFVLGGRREPLLKKEKRGEPEDKRPASRGIAFDRMFVIGLAEDQAVRRSRRSVFLVIGNDFIVESVGRIRKTRVLDDADDIQSGIFRDSKQGSGLRRRASYGEVEV